MSTIRRRRIRRSAEESVKGGHQRVKQGHGGEGDGTKSLEVYKCCCHSHFQDRVLTLRASTTTDDNMPADYSIGDLEEQVRH